MNLNENIKKLRTGGGITQTQFAKEMGVTKQCVSNWENDNVLPSVEMLVKIAEFFSVSTDEILGIKPKTSLNLDGLTPEEAGHIRSIVNDLKKK